jgi:transposase
MIVEKGRYVGIDLGKRTWEMAVITRTGKLRRDGNPAEKVTRFHGRTAAEGRLGLYAKLEAGDKVALETGNLAFIMAKELGKTAGCTTRVPNPSKLAVTCASTKKTDREDAMKLAQPVCGLPDSRLPTVAVPSDRETERRKLVSGDRREQTNRTQAVNRLHGLFVHAGITTVVKKDLATDGNRRKAVEMLEGAERAEAEHLVECLALFEKRIGYLAKRMAELAKGDEVIERLQSVPGVGPKISFVFSAYINGNRFENGSQVSNYLGLAPRVYMSGSLIRYGAITKRGNGILRSMLVQGAWALVRSKNGGALKERFEYMTKIQGKGKKKAIVAVARKLGVLPLMKNGTCYEVGHFKAGRRGAKSAELLAAEALSA